MSAEADLVWEYIRLDNKLAPANFIERLSLYSALVVHPLWNILYWFTWLFFPGIFVYLGGSYEIDSVKFMFILLNAGHVVYSAFTKWSEVLQHYNLGTTLLGWRLRTLRIPKIHIRSNDVRHQYFKYAAAITLQSHHQTHP
jgi:hypothetical protein